MDTVFVSSFELVESLHLFIPPRRLTVMRLQQNNLTNFAGIYHIAIHRPVIGPIVRLQSLLRRR